MPVMRTARVLTLAASLAGILGATSATEFRVSEPVTVPGVPTVTLGPGTYLIRPLDSHGGDERRTSPESTEGLCLYDRVDDSGESPGSG